MKRVCMFILLTISVFCLQGSQSQVTPEKFKVAVWVAEDKNTTNSEKRLNNLARSYLKRELRSLGDVEIVDAISDYRTFQYIIMIAMVEVEYANRSTTGLVAMKFSKMKRIPINRFDRFWREHYTENPAFEVPTGAIATFIVKNLDHKCKEIVASFDTKILEPERLFR